MLISATDGWLHHTKLPSAHLHALLMPAVPQEWHHAATGPTVLIESQCMPPKQEESIEPSEADIAYWNLLYWAQKAIPKAELHVAAPAKTTRPAKDSQTQSTGVGTKGPSLLNQRVPTPY